MMKKTTFQQEMSALFPEIVMNFGEPMSKHTSFRIGGNVEIMAFPKNAEEIKKLRHYAELRNIPCRILGAGTNVLAPDEEIPGMVICLKDCLDGIQVLDDCRLRVYAGVTMTKAAVYAAVHNLGGLEFAHGIPGTVGGGVYMNAGAYGGEICQICESVDVLTKEGELRTYSCEDMGFSYRHSRLEDDGGIVISAVFALAEKPEAEIRLEMQELMKRRSASQPLDLPSAGSAFKRPVGGYAAALIDQSGLKGFRVGNAAISEKHAGFAVNLGGATALDVRKLLNRVSDIVFEKTGIRLEPEVRIW